MKDDTLRASEIGQFHYCERAWWYARSGKPSANTQLLEAGSMLHEAHARKIQRWAVLQRLGQGALLTGIILIVLHFAAGFL